MSEPATLLDSLITAACASVLFALGLAVRHALAVYHERRRERAAVRQWRERVENLRLRRGEKE